MRVIVIDNDEAWTRSLSILFSARGYDVQVFNNPIMACEYIGTLEQDKNEMPNAIVLDYLMPEMSGFKVLGWIADNLDKSCRIVFVTGYSEQLENAHLDEMGIAACLKKPVDFDELVNVLEGNAA